MRKILISCLAFLLITCSLQAQEYRTPVKPTKNVILMIPDGVSVGVYATARWYQIYNKLGGDRLAIDPYMCGMVKTYNSNAPVGDSAPTTSCYMTGYLSQAGNVAIYPAVDLPNDIYPVDASKSYQPLTTILEAAKITQNKATGLVVTVDFPHATPADCSSHYYNRSKYNYLSSQIAYNNIDVVMGGGTHRLTDDIKARLAKTDTELIVDDVNAFRKFDGDKKVWALFDKMIPYEIDRDNTKYPSLAEMTEKAIDRLSKDENGFFLMVEGSQVDWAAHSNDGVAIITEYLAFDQAVQKAIDFAKKDGNTTVVILPDHGNSGFTFGSAKFKNYAKRGLDDVFKTVSGYKCSGRKLAEILKEAELDNYKSIVKEYTGIEITEDEYNLLEQSRMGKAGKYTDRTDHISLESATIKIMNDHTYFGYVSGNHTGEDVLLAAYHPNGDIPLGMNTNQELHAYLHAALGLTRQMDDITAEIYAEHTNVFAGMDYKIDTSKEFAELIVKKGKNTLVVPAFKSIAFINGKEIELGSVTTYMDKNETFYLPKKLRDELK